MSGSGMDDIADGMSNEVSDQKDQQKRAVKEAMQNYGDRKKEEGKKEIYRKTFLTTVFFGIFGSAMWAIDEILEGNENSTNRVTQKRRSEEASGQTISGFGEYRAAQTLQQSHTGTASGITEYNEDDEIIKSLSDNLKDATFCDQDLNRAANEIYDKVKLRNQAGNSRGGDYRFHVGPVFDDASGFQNVDLMDYFEENRGELSADEDDWRELSNIEFSSDSYGMMYLSDGANNVVENSVAVLDEEQTVEMLEGAESENPGQYSFERICG